MADPHASTLRRLSYAGGTLSAPEADARGRRVVDAGGVYVGLVDDLYADDRERRVRFLLVVAGGFPGPCETEHLIPAEVVTRSDSDGIHVCCSRDRVTAAPAYDPCRVDEEYLAGVARHYGFRPYWET